METLFYRYQVQNQLRQAAAQGQTLLALESSQDLNLIADIADACVSAAKQYYAQAAEEITQIDADNVKLLVLQGEIDNALSSLENIAEFL